MFMCILDMCFDSCMRVYRKSCKYCNCWRVLFWKLVPEVPHLLASSDLTQWLGRSALHVAALRGTGHLLALTAAAHPWLQLWMAPTLGTFGGREVARQSGHCYLLQTELLRRVHPGVSLLWPTSAFFFFFVMIVAALIGAVNVRGARSSCLGAIFWKRADWSG